LSGNDRLGRGEEPLPPGEDLLQSGDDPLRAGEDRLWPESIFSGAETTFSERETILSRAEWIVSGAQKIVSGQGSIASLAETVFSGTEDILSAPLSTCSVRQAIDAEAGKTGSGMEGIAGGTRKGAAVAARPLGWCSALRGDHSSFGCATSGSGSVGGLTGSALPRKGIRSNSTSFSLRLPYACLTPARRKLASFVP